MKESLLTDVFLNAGFFLALAAIVIPLLKYFKIPIALGYLLAGVALGPYALGAFSDQSQILSFMSLQDSQHIKILAELGIVLLLFIIGLELTPLRLWKMRHLVFGLGGMQVIVTAFCIGTIAYLWGNNVQVSILLGLGLSLSSTALILQWLQEKKLFATNVGRTSFSILLFQDMAVIPILLLLTILSSDLGDDVFQFVSISLLKMAVTVLALFAIGKIILKPVFIFANRHGGSEVFMALSLLVIVGSSLIASLAGLSMALGAFIAGLLLADTEYRHEISGLIMPFKSMLLGIFFVSFGMGINLSFIAEEPLWLFSSVFGLMIIKGCIIFTLCKIWKQSTSVSVENGIILSQAGEFGLLVVGTALSVGLMEQNIGQFMLIVVGITMMLTPIITPLARKIGNYIENKCHGEQTYHANKAAERNNHIVVFGFGRVGNTVANTLSQEGYSILGFDKDIEQVNAARSRTCPVYLGDASNKNTLMAAKLNKAICVVITLDEAPATRKIVKAVRNINDSIPIVVRAHTQKDANSFNDYENVDAIAENQLISSRLSEKVLSHCDHFDSN
jgi:CPA2 family monovalent cation:H+ antiporter-2